MAADPFREHRQMPYRRAFNVLGARLLIDCDSRELMAVAAQAFEGLPRHSWPAPMSLHVSLSLGTAQAGRSKRQPAKMQLSSGQGLLHGVMGAGNVVVIAPAARSASIIVTRDMLRFPYHLRYEIIEFVALTLAARAQRLVPLHAACIGRRGKAVLLLGDSGAGKSTLTLLGALAGFEVVAEDSVFVAPKSLRATGLARYLHVKAGSLALVERPGQRAAIRRAPVIRRRSGAKKFAYDLRAAGHALAPKPMELCAVIRLMPASRRDLLRTLDRPAMLKQVRSTQSYARAQPGWPAFERSLARLPAFSLARARDPAEALAALDGVLLECGR